MPTSYGTAAVGQLLLGLPAVGDLRDRVDADRLQLLQLAGRLVERVVGGQPALVHARRGERREADHVADREDVRHRGAVLLVDGDPAAVVRATARPSPGRSSSVTPCRPAEYMTMSAAIRLPLARLVTVPRGGDLDLGHLLAEPERHGLVAQVELQRLDDLGVAEVEHRRALLDDGHPGAERGEHRGVLDADHPGADHDHRAGHPLQLQHAVGVEHVLVVELDLGRPGRPGARWRSRCSRR